MAQEHTAVEPTKLKVGDGLYVMIVQGSSLQEQDLNAQVLDPTKFQRLVANIKLRGGLESMPYCNQPGEQGPIAIISGHHRAKAAREAGLSQFAVLVDTWEYPKAIIRAKQIAHNELTGSPDEELLRRMVVEIDDVEALLMTGLPEDFAPRSEPLHTQLQIPHADFDWKLVTLTFLPAQLGRLEDLVSLIDRHAELVGVANLDQFEAFSKALVDYSQVRNIKSMAAVVDVLTQIALRELAVEEEPDAEQ